MRAGRIKGLNELPVPLRAAFAAVGSRGSRRSIKTLPLQKNYRKGVLSEERKYLRGIYESRLWSGGAK